MLLGTCRKSARVFRKWPEVFLCCLEVVGSFFVLLGSVRKFSRVVRNWPEVSRVVRNWPEKVFSCCQELAGSFLMLLRNWPGVLSCF